MGRFFLMLWLAMAANADNSSLPLKGAVVLRPANATEEKLVEALPEIRLLDEKPGKSIAEVAKQVKAAGTKIAAGKTLYLVAAGPMLDGPDRAELYSLVRGDGELALKVRYTSARLAGKPLRRNIQWRPVVVVPVELPAGKWEVSAEWMPYDELPKGKAIGKATLNTAEFDLASQPR